jgi:hypothetical protein
MTKKKNEYDDYYKKKRGVRNLVIACLVFLIPGVLALIGFNALLIFAATNIFLAFLVEALQSYVVLINIGLIFFNGFIGLFLGLAIWDLKSHKKKEEKRRAMLAHNVIPPKEEVILPKEEVILQFLTKNKGSAFTSASLIKRINHEELSEEIEPTLNRLVEENKITRTVKDFTTYYSM